MRLNELGRLKQLAGLAPIDEDFGREWDKAFQNWEEVAMDRGYHVEHNDTGRAEYEMTVNTEDDKNFLITIDTKGGGTISSMQGGKGRVFTDFLNNPEDIADKIDSMN